MTVSSRALRAVAAVALTASLAAGIEPWATLYHWDPAAGAGGRRWLAGAGHGRPVRRVRGAGVRGARRPGTGVDHAQRTVVLGVPRVRRRGARARPARSGRGGPGGAPPAARARSRGFRDPGRGS